MLSKLPICLSSTATYGSIAPSDSPEGGEISGNSIINESLVQNYLAPCSFLFLPFGEVRRADFTLPQNHFSPYLPVKQTSVYHQHLQPSGSFLVIQYLEFFAVRG